MLEQRSVDRRDTCFRSWSVGLPASIHIAIKGKILHKRTLSPRIHDVMDAFCPLRWNFSM